MWHNFEEEGSKGETRLMLQFRIIFPKYGLRKFVGYGFSYLVPNEGLSKLVVFISHLLLKMLLSLLGRAGNVRTLLDTYP